MQRGEVEQVAELDRLRQVAVEHLALVLDHDAPLVALAQLADHLDLLLHLLGVPEDAEVLEHRLAELVADLPRPLARSFGRAAPSPTLGVAPRRLGVAGRARVARARTRPRAGPARRPKVIVSISELPPSRFAPWTETQATSPAA